MGSKRSVVDKKNSTLYWIAVAIPFLWGFWTFHHFELQSHFDFMHGEMGDARFIQYILENYYQAMQGKANVASPGFFYPTQGVLGYTDAVTGAVPLYSFLRVLHLDMYDAVQASLLLSDLLTFLACFWFLVKIFDLKAFPASVGAAFFCFNSIKYNQMQHYNFQYLYLLPLLFLCLAWVAKNHERLRPWQVFGFLALAGCLMDLQFLTSFYMGWFCAFWFGIFIFVCLWFEESRRFLAGSVLKFRWSFAGALLVFLLGLIPFFALYLPVLGLKGSREFGLAFDSMPHETAFAWMGPENSLWGWLGARGLDRMPGEWENRLGLGLAFTLFALFAFGITAVHLVRMFLRKEGKSRSGRTDLLPRLSLVEVILVLSTALSILSIVRIHNHNYMWHLTYLLVPGAKAMRCISRFMLFLALPMSLMLALWVQRWLPDLSRSKTLLKKALAVAPLVLFLSAIWSEQMGGKPFPGIPKGRDRERITALAAKVPRSARAFYVTLGPEPKDRDSGAHQVDAMLVSITAGIPTLNGYDSSPPPGWNLNLEAQDYPQRVHRWIEDHQLGDNIFNLEINDED